MFIKFLSLKVFIVLRFINGVAAGVYLATLFINNPYNKFIIATPTNQLAPVPKLSRNPKVVEYHQTLSNKRHPPQASVVVC